MGENPQSAYHVAHELKGESVDQDVYEAMRLYMVADLGIPEETADRRAMQEIERGSAVAAARELERAGVRIDGADTLDLGAGLGTMSEELLLRGANIIALEPGAAWANIVRRRLERHGKPFRLIQGFGEAIDLPEASVDLVVSLQVLEHVQDPHKVLSEAWRVLRPGGHFYLICENYLAFREGHYQVPWFPLLPKNLGALYLRALGRDPQFLREAVTYVTYPGILQMCRRIGFARLRDKEMTQGLRSKQGLKWAILRRIAQACGPNAPLMLDRARVTFKFGVYEIFEKGEARV